VKMSSYKSSTSQLEVLDSGLPANVGNRGLWSNLRNRESAFALACCAIVLVCVVLANPFANAGFDDDWSYSDVALRFAQTGHIHYNGWGSPTLLVQTLWAALCIKLFGFSFNLLRLATLPFSLGFVWMVYLLGRKIGLRRGLAGFGTLAVGTSPLFIPLAASFMTEAYACFFTTLSIYAAIRSAEARDGSPAALWLWVLVLSGIVGGSDRQTVWVAPIALIPYLFWTRRLDRKFTIHCVAAYAVCIASIAWVLVNFRPPYAPLQLPKHKVIPLVIDNFPIAIVCVLSALLSCSLVSLPIFLCTTPLWRTLGRLRLITFGLVCAAVAAILTPLGWLGTAPFVGNVLTSSGILRPGLDALGFKPEVLPFLLCISLTWLVVFVLIASARLYQMIGIQPDRVAFTIFAIFSGVYVLCMLPGALFGLTYDRYMLPLLPLTIFLILSSFQSCMPRVPSIAWACLGVFAAYGIVTTHDYSAALRARTVAAESLEQRGVPRNHISAGFEYDGWTQLQLTGTIRAPSLGEHPPWNLTDTFWLWSYTNAIQPQYVVRNSRASANSTSGLPAITFTTWLPPFRRSAVVSRRSDLMK
jgi:hypothetical protein